MSRSTTATVVVRVNPDRERLLRELRALCPDLAAVPTSFSLAALAKPTLGQDGTATAGTLGRSGLGQLEARTAALAAIPGAEAALRVAVPELHGTAQRLLAESRSALAARDPNRAAVLARQGDETLCAALIDSALRISNEERTLAASVLADALRSMGCRTLVAEGEGTVGIWAERGHQVAAVLVEQGGVASLDLAGFEGDECLPFHREIEQAVAERGGTLENARSVEHADRRGGVLIHRAALAAGAGGNLAEGLVRQAGGRESRRSLRTEQHRRTDQAQRVRGAGG
jgi:hypothetical protein